MHVTNVPISLYHVGKGRQVLRDHHGDIKGGLDGRFVPTGQSPSGVCGLCVVWCGVVRERWKAREIYKVCVGKVR